MPVGYYPVLCVGRAHAKQQSRANKRGKTPLRGTESRPASDPGVLHWDSHCILFCVSYNKMCSAPRNQKSIKSTSKWIVNQALPHLCILNPQVISFDWCYNANIIHWGQRDKISYLKSHREKCGKCTWVPWLQGVTLFFHCSFQL